MKQVGVSILATSVSSSDLTEMCLIQCMISKGTPNLYLNGVRLGVKPKTCTKRHVLKRDWTTCLKNLSIL